jgi:hypothetical protein
MPRRVTCSPRAFGLRDDAVDRGGDLAEILIERADIDIGGAAQAVVIHLGGRLNAGDVADGVQAGGCGAAGPAQRNGAQIVQVLHLALGILHGQHIVVAALGIDPVAGRDHAVGGERGDDVVHHFALIQAQLAGAGAIDIEAQRRVVDVLRRVDVGHAGILRIRAESSSAASCDFCILAPSTCTSMGAGMPIFSTASTRPPDWK